MAKKIYSNTSRIPAVKMVLDTTDDLDRIVNDIGFGDVVYVENAGLYFKKTKSSFQIFSNSYLSSDSFATELLFDRDKRLASQTITSNLLFTLASSGNVAGVSISVQLNFNGTSALTIPTPNAIYESSFTNGGNPSSGDYDLVLFYDTDGVIKANLKTIVINS